jgi:hypothetical protein
MIFIHLNPAHILINHKIPQIVFDIITKIIRGQDALSCLGSETSSITWGTWGCAEVRQRSGDLAGPIDVGEPIAGT